MKLKAAWDAIISTDVDEWEEVLVNNFDPDSLHMLADNLELLIIQLRVDEE